MDSSSTCTNDVYNIEGSVNNGIQFVSFTRNLSTSENVDYNYPMLNSLYYVIIMLTIS